MDKQKAKITFRRKNGHMYKDVLNISTHKNNIAETYQAIWSETLNKIKYTKCLINLINNPFVKMRDCEIYV